MAEPTRRKAVSRAFLAATVCAIAVPLAWNYWPREPVAPPSPYTFPFAELASLDHDLQARFAVIPEGNFGMSRVGRMHYLYLPENNAERQTIAQLKQKKWDVAFYLMSRRTWLNERGHMGYYPIQGPVYITRKLKGPLPRKWMPSGGTRTTGFIKKKMRLKEYTVEQTEANGNFMSPTPTPPPDSLPERHRLYDAGYELFDKMAQLPDMQQIGSNVQLESNPWKITAVPIRASSQACVKCHNSHNLSGEKGEVKLGDALGIAMYAYRRH
jgi:hypothetical protein